MRGKRFAITGICTLALGLMLTGHATAAVLLNDTFSDGDLATATTVGDVNGGFNVVSNGTGSVGSGSSSETGGNGVATANKDNRNQGIASVTGFNAASVPNGITVTFDVASTNDPFANGLNLGLSSLNNTFILGAAPSIYLSFYSDTNSIQNSAYGFALNYLPSFGGSVTALAVHQGTLASPVLNFSTLADGFTASFTLTPTGWSYALTGVSPGSGGSAADLTGSGTWTGSGTTFEDFMATTKYVNAAIQTQQSASTVTARFDQITVESVAVVAAPAPAALPGGLALMGLIYGKRRRH